jgi:hypothetical protein
MKSNSKNNNLPRTYKTFSLHQLIKFAMIFGYKENATGKKICNQLRMSEDDTEFGMPRKKEVT